VGISKKFMHCRSVDLPPPLGPMRKGHLARRDLQIDALRHEIARIGLVQPADFEQRLYRSRRRLLLDMVLR
jgi:hypothetical protein